MVGPIRFDGLSSGIDYTSIIQKLVSIQTAPLADLQSQVKAAGVKKTDLLDINASLLALKGIADQFSRPSFFNQTAVSSSNTGILTASGSQVGEIGAFQFTSLQLAASQQLLSSGFADSGTTAVTSSAGSIKIDVGGGWLDRQTPATFLNAQTGFDRGQIKITDSAGKVGIIDLSGAVTVQDVINDINNSTAVGVRAFTTGDRLAVQDTAGGAGTLSVANYGLHSTASSLGIAGTGVFVGPGQFVFGSDINTLSGSTSLGLLNDGLGVRRNADGVADFTITDTAGISFGVDIKSTDTTINNVISRINSSATAAGSALTASLSPDSRSIVLNAPAGASGITVTKAPDSFAAVDLGLGTIDPVTGSFVQVGAENGTTGAPSATGNRLYGNRLAPGLDSTMRELLNGGQTNTVAGVVKGIRDGSIAITDRTGASVTVNLASRVAASITSATATSVTLSSAAGFAVGNQIRIATGGTLQTRTVTSIAGTTVSFDKPLSTVPGAGDTAYAVNESLNDIVNNINQSTAAAGVKVKVQINANTDGLQAVDTSGGSGTLSIANVGGGFTASDLGIAGSVSANSINGTALHPEFIGENTQLSTLNQGAGVAAGSFQVIDTNGKKFTVPLSLTTGATLGQVILNANAAAAAATSGVRFRINNTGDGLLVQDTTPGSGKLQISELNGGATATNLNIVGTAPTSSPAVIDGSFNRSITIAAGSKLQDVVQAINGSGLPVSASIINDGSALNPFKISLIATKSGNVGRVVVNSQISGLAFATTSAAQNSVLLYGTTGGASSPAVLTSNTNEFGNIVPGLTVDLQGTSASPVTVTVSRDTANIMKQANALVDKYNAVIDKMNQFASFDPKSFSAGPLFSDSTLRMIRRQLQDLIVQPVSGLPAGANNSLAALGFSLNGQGGLTLDSSKLQNALTTNFDNTVSFFTLQTKLDFTTPLSALNKGVGVTNYPGNDFEIQTMNALKKLDISVSPGDTIQSLLDKINLNPSNGGAITASISTDGFSLQIVDNTTIPTRSVSAPTSTTTFTTTDADLTGLPANFLQGATVTFTSGADNGQVRTISASSGGTLTLSSALPSAPGAGDTYTLQRPLAVVPLNGSPNASELKIQQTNALGQNTIKSGLLLQSNPPGAGSRMSNSLDQITRLGDGWVANRTSYLDGKVTDLNKRIDQINQRAKKVEESLIKQFAHLETVLAQNQQTLARLQASLLSFAQLGSSGGTSHSGASATTSSGK